MTDSWMLFYPELFLGGLAFTCWLHCSKNWCILRALMEAHERRACMSWQKLCNFTWSSAGESLSLLCHLYYIAWPNVRDEVFLVCNIATSCSIFILFLITSSYPLLSVPPPQHGVTDTAAELHLFWVLSLSARINTASLKPLILPAVNLWNMSIQVQPV